MSKSRTNLPRVDNNLIEVKSKVSYATKFTQKFYVFSSLWFGGLVEKILQIDLIL